MKKRNRGRIIIMTMLIPFLTVFVVEKSFADPPDYEQQKQALELEKTRLENEGSALDLRIRDLDAQQKRENDRARSQLDARRQVDSEYQSRTSRKTARANIESTGAAAQEARARARKTEIDAERAAIEAKIDLIKLYKARKMADREMAEALARIDKEIEKYRQEKVAYQAEIQKILATRDEEVRIAELKKRVEAETEELRLFNARLERIYKEKDFRDKREREDLESITAVAACAQTPTPAIITKLWEGQGVQTWRQLQELHLRYGEKCDPENRLLPEHSEENFRELKHNVAFASSQVDGMMFLTPLLQVSPDLVKTAAKLPEGELKEQIQDSLSIIEEQIQAFYAAPVQTRGDANWMKRKENLKTILIKTQEIEKNVRNARPKTPVVRALVRGVSADLSYFRTLNKVTEAQQCDSPTGEMRLGCRTLEHPPITDLEDPSQLLSASTLRLCPNRSQLLSLISSSKSSNNNLCGPVGTREIRTKPFFAKQCYEKLCNALNTLVDCVTQVRTRAATEINKAPAIPAASRISQTDSKDVPESTRSSSQESELQKSSEAK